MRTFYIVYEDEDTTDHQGIFVTAPTESVALRSLPDGVELVEVLEFDEDEAVEFGLFDTEEGDDDYRELDFDHGF